jgi:hypothetical protein
MKDNCPVFIPLAEYAKHGIQPEEHEAIRKIADDKAMDTWKKLAKVCEQDEAMFIRALEIQNRNAKIAAYKELIMYLNWKIEGLEKG